MFDILNNEYNQKNTPRFSVVKTIILLLVLGFVAVSVIAIYFFGNRWAAVQISTASKEISNQYENRLKDQEILIEKYRQDQKNQAELNSFDRIRMGDATNILLALQNYNFEKNNLPGTLKDLAAGDFYNGNLIDPQTGNEYFYEKIDAQNYILCFYLSTGIWGTNKNQCPADVSKTNPNAEK